MIFPPAWIVWRAAGLLLGLAAMLPERGRTTPRVAPHPASTYRDAVVRIHARQTGDDSVVAPGGRSILLDHGGRTQTVFLLLHGFTDAPTQFATVGAELYATGANVFIPRLPHHALRVNAVHELGRVNAGELAAFGDSVVDAAAGLGDSIVVVGLSAGAVVGAYVAQHRHDIARALLVAPAIAAGRVPDRLETPLVKIATRLPNVSRTTKPASASEDSAALAFDQGISTHGLAQVLRLGAVVRAEADASAPAVHQITFVLNQSDRVVSSGAALDLARHWSRRGAIVNIYEFARALDLPHNLMEMTAHEPSLDSVMSVIVSLARGDRPALLERVIGG